MGKVLNWMKGISDEAADGAIARQAAITEIESTRGFKLITTQFELERKWASKKLEQDVDYEETIALRSYIKAIDILGHLLRTTSQNAEIARKSVITQRPQEMDINSYHELVFNKG